MLLPVFLLGRKAEVAARALRFVRSSADDAALDMVDTRNVAAEFIVRKLRGEAPGEHFHLYAPWRAALDQDPRHSEFTMAVFERLLKLPWGPLALLDPSLGLVQLDDDQSTRFLRATVRGWTTFVAAGARYQGGLGPKSLWHCAFSLWPKLAARGVPEDELQAPLPNDDLRELLLRHSEAFADVLIGDLS